MCCFVVQVPYNLFFLKLLLLLSTFTCLHPVLNWSKSAAGAALLGTEEVFMQPHFYYECLLVQTWTQLRGFLVLMKKTKFFSWLKINRNFLQLWITRFVRLRGRSFSDRLPASVWDGGPPWAAGGPAPLSRHKKSFLFLFSVSENLCFSRSSTPKGRSVSVRPHGHLLLTREVHQQNPKLKK